MLEDVVADDLVVAPAEFLDQRPLLRERLRVGASEAVLTGHVHSEELSAGRARGDAGTAANQRLPLGTTGEGDDDALPRLPLRVDPLLSTIMTERAVDLVGEPQKGKFAERREVSEAEVVRQCRIDSLGRIDPARRQPVPKGLRRQVDDLDLLG